jgi:molybdate transport system regulatory protein
MSVTSPGQIKDLSTRNQLDGKVTGVQTGTVMAEVKVDVQGQEFVAAVTRHSVERLNVAEGDAVTVLVKATEVMIAKSSSQLDSLSTRNQIKGKVASIESGTVMAEVKIDVNGNELAAAVTRHSVERLGLAQGDDVIVLVKATEVMLAK